MILQAAKQTKQRLQDMSQVQVDSVRCFPDPQCRHVHGVDGRIILKQHCTPGRRRISATLRWSERVGRFPSKVRLSIDTHDLPCGNHRSFSKLLCKMYVHKRASSSFRFSMISSSEEHLQAIIFFEWRGGTIATAAVGNINRALRENTLPSTSSTAGSVRKSRHGIRRQTGRTQTQMHLIDWSVRQSLLLRSSRKKFLEELVTVDDSLSSCAYSARRVAIFRKRPSNATQNGSSPHPGSVSFAAFGIREACCSTSCSRKLVGKSMQVDFSAPSLW